MPSSLSPSTGVAEKTVKVKVIQKSTTVAASVKESVWSVMDFDDEALNLMLMSGDARTDNEKKQSQLNQQYYSPRPPLVVVPEEANGIPHANSMVAVNNKSDTKSDRTILRENDSSTSSESASSLPFSSISQSLPPVNPIEILKSLLKTKDLQQFFHKTWSLYLTNTGGQIEFKKSYLC